MAGGSSLPAPRMKAALKSSNAMSTGVASHASPSRRALGGYPSGGWHQPSAIPDWMPGEGDSGISPLSIPNWRPGEGDSLAGDEAASERRVCCHPVHIRSRNVHVSTVHERLHCWLAEALGVAEGLKERATLLDPRAVWPTRRDKVRRSFFKPPAFRLKTSAGPLFSLVR